VASNKNEIGMNRIFKRFSIGLGVVLGLSTAALAQWSIGQPGTREAPKGQNRYVYLVMADPLPGREADFNDGYQNMHMGDLVQLPGWTGAQRFRLVPDVTPRNIQPLYRRGNLIIWDQEGADLGKLQSDSRAAIAGGKSRLIPGFDYSDGGAVRAIPFMQRENATLAGAGTPFHLAYLAAQRKDPSTPLFPHVRAFPGGGAPKPPQLHYDVKSELGGIGIVSGWGLTEAPILTMGRHDDPDEKLANTGTIQPGTMVWREGKRANSRNSRPCARRSPSHRRIYTNCTNTRLVVGCRQSWARIKTRKELRNQTYLI